MITIPEQIPGRRIADARDREPTPPEPAEPSVWKEGSLEITSIDGEPFFQISNVNEMPPFLMSIVSDTDLWLFVGSNTAFTAGRIDPDHALFPYLTVDKILHQPDSTGVQSIFRIESANGPLDWEPWHSSAAAGIQRNLYKHALGTSVVFEEIHFGLELRFRWSLELSNEFGLIRRCKLTNLSERKTSLRYLDGWRLLLPAGVGEQLYSRYSYLACAYMRHERLGPMGLYTLNCGVTDRAEPCESLRAACSWSLGHTDPVILLSERQVATFRSGGSVENEDNIRGEFGAYFVVDAIDLKPGAEQHWTCVADTGLDHAGILTLRRRMKNLLALEKSLTTSLEVGRQGLKRRGAAADGVQKTSDASLDAHHFANTIFNCMRGGIPENSYSFPASDFAQFLHAHNRPLAMVHAAWLEALPPTLDLDTLHEKAVATGDAHILRLAREYLPLLFSRRHGDPSRPWNRFSILLRHENGQPIYGYQGNWRDIFQNWESLAQSYPRYLDAMISVFLNASTADGYNPYRITRDGIDWEVFDPEDPWSQIGYWGDHQIVYLSRLLESLENHEPGKLASGLGECLYASAVVPYEIAGFEDLLRDPRHSIRFDKALQQDLTARADKIGNDGKLLAGENGEVALFSLAEKLLVPVLAKISNLVPGGGIWLNTQRPEWNDANNALAGWGLSVVTVFHLRRHLLVLQNIFSQADGEIPISVSVATFLRELAEALRGFPEFPTETLHDAVRLTLTRRLGEAGENHRRAVYTRTSAPAQGIPAGEILSFLKDALAAVEATLSANFRTDGLVQSYNLLSLVDGGSKVSRLDLMLEGQVAAIGSGFLSSKETLRLLAALRVSKLYRKDQHSYMLQPDREIASFLTRNRLPSDAPERCALIARLLLIGDRSVVIPDVEGTLHFHPDFTNASDLERRLDLLADLPDIGPEVDRDRKVLLKIWEEVFHHGEFTGRSGSIFGFEGLGSIYWHMVAKLLLAVQESWIAACEDQDRSSTVDLVRAYRDIREGLGFRKSPAVYGAFPTDPYSHTPGHRGAQQPGMTGQVKEEILTRLGELGVQVRTGCIRFDPRLLEAGEFCADGSEFAYVDVHGKEQTLDLPASSLGFTCCQVPVSLQLARSNEIHVEWKNGKREKIVGKELPSGISWEIFSRSGMVSGITVKVPPGQLLS